MTYDDWLSRETDSNDPGRLRDEPERDPVECCDTCGRTLSMYRTSIGGVGQFCDRVVRPECAIAGVKRHEQAMARLVTRAG
jgi:hypothetical protein